MQLFIFILSNLATSNNPIIVHKNEIGLIPDIILTNTYKNPNSNMESQCHQLVLFAVVKKHIRILTEKLVEKLNLLRNDKIKTYDQWDIIVTIIGQFYKILEVFSPGFDSIEETHEKLLKYVYINMGLSSKKEEINVLDFTKLKMIKKYLMIMVNIKSWLKKRYKNLL